MRLDRIVDVFGITTAHRRHHRQVAITAGGKNQLVSAFQSIQCQFQSAQTVTLKWIYARLVKNKIGFEVVQNTRYLLAQDSQILFVADAVRQMNVELALLFARREVLLAMN